MPVKKKKTYKRIINLVLAVAGILMATIILSVYLFGEEYAKEKLANLMLQKTSGQYEIHFSNLTFNPISRSISIDELQVTTTKNNKNKLTLHFSSSSFHVHKIGIIDLLKNKRLSIKKISVQKPLIQFSNNLNKQNDKESAAELIQLISPFLNKYFNSIEINEIELIDAGLLNKKPSSAFFSTNKVIGFNVGIKQFYTDSIILSKGGDFFEADDVFLKIEDYRKQLGDSIHQIKVDELVYSIKNKGIYAQHIALSPLDSVKDENTRYWVNVPDLHIQSKNIDEIFQQDSIRIDTLELKKARIKVVPPENSSGINFREIKEFDLFQVVKNDFSQLKIGHLKLQADLLRIERIGKNENTQQDFENLAVRLERFQLDSISSSNLKKILYADQLFLRVGHYNIKLNDQIHQFNATNIIASSHTNSLSADSLSMWANENTSGNHTKVSMNCDSIRMHDVDLPRLFHFREMPLQEIAAYKPAVSIKKGISKNDREQNSNSLLYDFIGNYIKGIYSNLVTIEQGQFAIINMENDQESGIIEAGFTFRLTDFSLDSISANKTDKLFFATNFDLEFNDYNMKLQDQLHRLQVERIDVSSLHKKATIKNLHLFANEKGDAINLLKKYKRSGLYEIKIPYLYLRNTDIHHAFFNKKLNINNFSIIKPNIYFELITRNDKVKNEFKLDELYGLLKTYINDIYIGQIHILNGQFRLVNHDKRGKIISFDNQFNLKLDGFKLNDSELKKDRLLFSDDFELSLKDHLFRLSDHVHYLQVNEIGFSTKQSSVLVKDAILYPDITSPFYNKMPRHLQVSIPELRLNGVDIRKAYFNRVLNVNNLTINKPDIKIYKTGKPERKLDLKDLSIPLPDEIKTLSLQNLALQNGHITILNAKQNQHHEIASLDIDLFAQDVSLASQKNNKPASFSASNISTELKKLEFTPDLGNYDFSLDNLNYSKANQKIQIQGFHISLKENLQRAGLTEANIPILELNGLNSNNPQRENCIHSTKVLANDAVFKFVKSTDEKNYPDLYYLKLNEDMLSFMDEFSAENVELRNATVYLKKNKKQLQYKNINLNLNGFRINDKANDKLLCSESLDFSIKNLYRTDKNKRYDLLANELKFSNYPANLSIRGIQINPRYSKEAFQEVIPFQADYYQGKIGLIEVGDIDIRRLFERNELIGKHIFIKNAKLDIFRDMRKTFNEDQRPAMPQKLIRDFGTPFYFDSVGIISSDISYSEQLENMPGPGKIYFHQVNARIYPFTNIEQMLNKQPTTLLHANALVMGKMELQTEMQFKLLSPQEEFHVQGSIAPFEMGLLNPMTRNAAQITIRSGNLNRFEFDFDANNLVAQGKLKFAYNDLKINILSIKDGDTKESRFASFLANSLMVKSKNPRTRILLPDAIYYERDPKRSILNYWWKSVFSGAKNTFGIKENKD